MPEKQGVYNNIWMTQENNLNRAPKQTLSRQSRFSEILVHQPLDTATL